MIKKLLRLPGRMYRKLFRRKPLVPPFTPPVKKVAELVPPLTFVMGMEGELQVVKSDDGVDYFADFLDLIDLPHVHMHEVMDTAAPRWCLRHDVDHDIDVAMAIARAEHDRGYRSTYFLLTPGAYAYGKNYYGWIEDGRIVHDDTLIEKCHYIESLGHRIGFHSDIISLSFLLKRPPGEILAEEVEFFTSNGIRLAGTAAHGSPLARELEYNNREIFRSCIRQGREFNRSIVKDGWEVKTHSLELAEFGFEYEAYSLPRDSRVSESGRRWGGMVAGMQMDRSGLAEQFDIDVFRDYIRRLTAANDIKSLQVMTHPDHWTVTDSIGNSISKQGYGKKHDG